MPDPLTDELLKRSWANPANRPPRDPTDWKLTRPETNGSNGTPLSQRVTIEDMLGFPQPDWNVDESNQGLMPNGQGGLNVVTDPKAILYDLRAHPELYPSLEELLQEAPDEDADDNKDESPEEKIARLMMRKL